LKKWQSPVWKNMAEFQFFWKNKEKSREKLVFKVLLWKRTGVQGVFTCDPVFYVCWLHTIKRHVSRVIKLTLLG